VKTVTFTSHYKLSAKELLEQRVSVVNKLAFVTQKASLFMDSDSEEEIYCYIEIVCVVIFVSKQACM
jgi:hypothetical protein